MNSISKCQLLARDEKGRKDAKQQKLRELLRDDVKTIPGGVESVPMPLDPTVPICGLIPENTIMFASAIYPAVVTFIVADQRGEGGGGGEDGGGEQTYKIIFKSGDDLRQDQLVMQMMNLMDGVLKKVNLDLEVLTYGILATGANDGIMEFVSPSLPVSAVLSKHKGIQNFLREHNPDKDAKATYGISPKVLDTFIRSCAGSCVLTYILGIGDRHLDNLMMKPDGHLFHVCIFILFCFLI